MKNPFKRISISLGLLIILMSRVSFCQNKIVPEKEQKPNIVLIVIDDLNDYIEGFGGHPQAFTPNISKLAQSGVSFLNAHSNSPICGPSRSSFLTGVYPHNSNNLFFDKWFENPVLANTNTIMEQFKNNGYQVIGSGKIMHHSQRSNWNEFKNPADYGPVVFNGKEGISHPDVPEPYRSIGKIDGSFGPFINLKNRTINGDSLQWATGNKWRGFREFKYVDDNHRSLTPDEKNALWAEKRLLELADNPEDAPFFLAVGFLRPHTPLVAPQHFFDRFPIDDIQLPVIKPNDANDTYFNKDENNKPLKQNRGEFLHDQIGLAYKDQELGLKKFIQAYLACTAAVDENVGQVMNAINNSKLKDNTIVVLVSDHGFQMGEKEYLFKNSLWEKSTRIPMVIRAPGITKPQGKVNIPVSLIDVYPTLVDLANISSDTKKNKQGHALDGFSLKSLLEDSSSNHWKGPKAALTMVYSGAENHKDPTKQHYSVRTKDWRYILYNTGKEELYNIVEDPNEWYNVLEYATSHTTKLKEMQEHLKNMTYPIVPAALKK